MGCLQHTVAGREDIWNSIVKRSFLGNQALYIFITIVHWIVRYLSSNCIATSFNHQRHTINCLLCNETTRNYGDFAFIINRDDVEECNFDDESCNINWTYLALFALRLQKSCSHEDNVKEIFIISLNFH